MEEYRALRRDVAEPVLDRLRRSPIADDLIRLLGERLFACFEYHGDDLAADLAAMAENPATQTWWRLTAPCRRPVGEAGPGEWWADMEQVFLLE
ncbi:L-rhamnose mutarotase [Streptomyces sp. NPDC000941]